MPLLYYWRPDNYARDREFGFGYHLNQNSPAMVKTGPGDSVWAFTRRKRDGLYVLAAELVVRAATRNPPNYRYGRYRVWADVERSRYFDLGTGGNAEPLITHLSIRTRGEYLGQAFQGYAAARMITIADHYLLASFARELPTIRRVGIYPEDEFEARLVHGEIARPLVVRESPEDYARRLEYLYETVDPHRARRNVRDLQELYDGRCQICLYDPRDRYGFHLCHGHHIQWLSRGGDDDLENMILVCPNHHAAIHHDDAPFDYLNLSFTFRSNLLEPVQLNRHLPQAS